MERLSLKKVFSKYNVTMTDRLSRASYSLYKKIRLGLSKFYPLKEYEKYRFEEHRMENDTSDEMPLGFNYVTGISEEGYLNLEYIDFYDYLPKEDLDLFKKELRKCVSRNKLSPFGVFRTHKDNDRIDNMGRYIDRMAFSNLLTIRFCRNEYLKRYSSQFSISLRNLSSSFLVVKYRLYISKEFNEQIKKICKVRYDGYTDICRQFNVPWFKPKQFGRSMYTGNDAREQELYKLISRLKWKTYREMKRSFTIHFGNNVIFPPTFETYSTNIRPNEDQKPRGFWNSVMSGYDADYAPKYNACVYWDYDSSEREGSRLAAYCGGNYSKTDHLPEIAQHEISDIYAVYVTASNMRRIAERDIAICNKKISRAIRKARTSSVLKVRVNVERKLYYSYRFISEFSGGTIEHDDVDEFRNKLYKEGSITSRCLQGISESTTETKNQIDNILKILNDSAEYGSSKSNINLQWIMMIITILSLLVAIITIFDTNGFSLKATYDAAISFIKTIFISK